MNKLSLIITPKSTSKATSLTSVISKENIDSIARNEGALIRERKFSLSAYIINAIHKMCASTKHSEFTLCSMHESYNRLNPDNALSHKCIHKQLQSDESLSTVKSLLGEALTLFQSKAFYRDLKKILPNPSGIGFIRSVKSNANVEITPGTFTDLKCFNPGEKKKNYGFCSCKIRAK